MRIYLLSRNYCIACTVELIDDVLLTHLLHKFIKLIVNKNKVKRIRNAQLAISELL